jgi:hypothetical protein
MCQGDRLNLVHQPCKCGVVNAEEATPKDIGRRRSNANEPEPKRTRGFGNDLDPKMHGVFETYERKCKQLDARFADMSPKEVVKKLLGRAASQMENDSDDDQELQSSSRSVGVTGEQGGRLLTCFLVRAAELDEPPSFLSDGVMAWLEKQVPKVQMYPAAKLCVAKAIKFLPKLQKCLALRAAEARAAGEPDLDFGSDDD